VRACRGSRGLMKLAKRQRLYDSPVDLASVVALALGLMLVPLTVYAFPWSIDMFRSPSVKPLEVAPRVMPSEALPTKNGELPQTRVEAAKSLHNPLKPSEENLAHGKELYETYCAVCHGTTGKGDGPVAYWLTLPPANLVTSASFQTDGYIYGTIRDGGLVMPSYADAMTPTERWQVVLYIRYLAGGKSPEQVGQK